MQRKDFYTGQKVTEAELDGAFNDAEVSINQCWSDQTMSGVISGFNVTEAGSPNLTVDVAAGVARSSSGERIRSAGTINVDCAFDRDGNPTTVNGLGNSRILSVIAFFDRTLSDPRTDAFSSTVYFVRGESLSVEIVQGSEALIPVAPSIPAGGVRLGNVVLIPSQTAIHSSDITITTPVKQWMFTHGAAGPVSAAVGTSKACFTVIYDALNQFLSGNAYNIDSANVVYSSTGAWADSSDLAALDVKAALDEIVSDLASIASGQSGIAKIGCDQDTSSPTTLSAGPLRARLSDMRQAINLYYTGSGNWKDGTPLAASSIEAALDSVVSSLASTTTSSSGARKVGIEARTTWLGGRTNASTDIFSAIDKIINDLGATTSNDDGAERIGIQARSNWLGGRTNPASDVSAAIEKIITDLAATTSSDDGAERIGAQANGNLSSGSVRSQLDQLDTAKAALAGAAFTGEVTQPRLSVGIRTVGVIASNTQITNSEGVVFCQCPASNSSNFNLALPTPASGNPLVFVKFYGGTGTSRRVWITDTTNIAISTPSNYYSYWDASASPSAGAVFGWDGSRWRHITSNGLTGTVGGGTLAE